MSSVVPAGDIGLKSILFATDLSKASDKPLRHALAIARHYGAKFYLAHVVSALGYTIAGPQALDLASDSAGREAQQLEHELVENGALTGLEHQVIIRQGNVWEELEQVIREEQIDFLVIGSYGRRGLGKLFLGSVAEQIFRHASCLVLTVGPSSCLESPVENAKGVGPILFATDFGAASLHALPYAISFANHFRTRLVLLHVLPAAQIPEGFHWSSTSTDVMKIRADARIASIQQLEEFVLRGAPLNSKPEFMVKFGMPSKEILHAANTLEAGLVIMGLNRSRHIDIASHMPWATAYSVVCAANCSALTIRA